MKKRILLAVSLLLIFGLAIAALAYTRTSPVPQQTACCCKDDLCPMRSKDAAATGEHASCCDMDDCCCKNGGESCPVKDRADHHSTSGETQQSCDCCGAKKDA